MFWEFQSFELGRISYSQCFLGLAGGLYLYIRPFLFTLLGVYVPNDSCKPQSVTEQSSGFVITHSPPPLRLELHMKTGKIQNQIEILFGRIKMSVKILKHLRVDRACNSCEAQENINFTRANFFEMLLTKLI